MSACSAAKEGLVSTTNMHMRMHMHIHMHTRAAEEPRRVFEACVASWGGQNRAQRCGRVFLDGLGMKLRVRPGVRLQLYGVR